MDRIIIGIVEDQEDSADLLKTQLIHYQKENGLDIQIERYSSGEKLLEKYNPETDILFLDIEMPGLSGMEAAKLLRADYRDVIMIFVTNLAQYAIRGYEVGAMDYLLKPVPYAQMAMRMDRALYILRNRMDAELVVNNIKGLWKVRSKEIFYIEVTGHWLYIHTKDQVIKCMGSLSEMEKKLAGQHFARCGAGFLVNMIYIRRVSGVMVLMDDGAELPIGRTRKKVFMNQVTEYFGKVAL